MKTKSLITASLFLSVAFQNINAQNIFPSNGNAGIGTNTPASSAALEINSINKGLLLPRMTKAQRDAIVSPVAGLLIFQTDNAKGIYQYDGTGWRSLNNNVKGLNNNLFIGQNAGAGISSGTGNIALGKGALKNTDVQLNNIAIGDSALYSNGAGSAGAGKGNENIAIGTNALRHNIDGNQNIAIGQHALEENTNGYLNTALGFYSMPVNTSGHDNAAFGTASLYKNTSGAGNTAVGSSSQFNTTSGEFNTSVGTVSLSNNTTGNLNTAIGYYVLLDNISGRNNTAVGDHTLMTNVSGNYNTALGAHAGSLNSNSSNCTFVGFDANFSSVTPYLTNSTAIGYASRLTAGSQVRVGNSSTLSIGGITSWTTLSDGRYKKDIKANVPGMDFINRLRPVTYHYDVKKLNTAIYKNDTVHFSDEEIKAKESELQTGFIAQEVEEAAKQSSYSFNGVDKPKNSEDMYGLRYAEFVVPIIKGLQELGKENKELKSKNEALENSLQEISAELSEIRKFMKNDIPSSEISRIKKTVQLTIYPNPVNDKLFFETSNAGKNAKLLISDANGSIVYSEIITADKTEVNVSSIASGIYFVTISEGNTTVASQQIIITH